MLIFDTSRAVKNTKQTQRQCFTYLSITLTWGICAEDGAEDDKSRESCGFCLYILDHNCISHLMIFHSFPRGQHRGPEKKVVQHMATFCTGEGDGDREREREIKLDI